MESNPNARITEEQYDLLVKEFSKDKSQKLNLVFSPNEVKNDQKGKLLLSKVLIKKTNQ